MHLLSACRNPEGQKNIFERVQEATGQQPMHNTIGLLAPLM